MPRIATLVTVRPTCGYRRITEILNRQLRLEGIALCNHKRVYRIMQAHNLPLGRKYSERPKHVHDGNVIVVRFNLRSPVGSNHWRLNGSLFGWLQVHPLERQHRPRCLNHRRPRPRNDRLACGGKFRDQRVRHPRHHTRGSEEWLLDVPCAYHYRDADQERPPPYIARDTQIFARQLGLKPCFISVRSPQSNGVSDAFAKTLKRNYVQVTSIPDAQTVLGLIGGWIEEYNDNHPHSGLKMRSPRDFIVAQTATA